MLIINFLKALSTPQQVKEQLFEMYGPNCVILCCYMWYHEALRTMF